MRRMLPILLSFLLVSLFISPALAQFGEPHGGGGYHGRGKGGPPRGPEFEKKMKAIEQYRMLKLLETLDLKDEQADQFLQMFREHREKMKEFRDKNFAIADTLSQLLQTENNDAEIDRLVTKMQKNKHDETEMFNTFFAETKSLLNSYQMGRLILFMERFDRQMIKDFIEKRGDMPAPEEDTAPSEGK